MSIWEAIALGVVQGLTEFLPVSSSGHLEIANRLFGLAEPDSLSFTIALHAGTVLSTIVVLRREIGNLISGVLRLRMNEQTMYMINIVISLLPILFVGLFLRDSVEALFTGNLLLVGCMLILTAGLLLFAVRAKPAARAVTPKRAFVMGLAQACAGMLPGLSRSGSTIAAGLVQGVDREEAARFSFLMVLIPIIGMSVLEFRDLGNAESIGVLNVATGFLTSFLVGWAACRWMIRLVGRGRLGWFALYCLVVGAASVVMNFVL